MVLTKIFLIVLHKYILIFKNWVVKCQFTDPYCSAFIAVSFTDAAIVLAFRGTDTFLQLQHEISDTLFRKKVPSVFGYGHVCFDILKFF
uniref:Uncharacterized protein n=1 Tax=Meloidogyne enterolobii TaxID=390850 RepID=A0A6V7W3F6_MELEN|nr:unnamed protein product [Meloidogyne enterolobii]